MEVPELGAEISCVDQHSSWLIVTVGFRCRKAALAMSERGRAVKTSEPANVAGSSYRGSVRKGLLLRAHHLVERREGSFG
jgi:hypothetical protein